MKGSRIFAVGMSLLVGLTSHSALADVFDVHPKPGLWEARITLLTDDGEDVLAHIVDTQKAMLQRLPASARAQMQKQFQDPHHSFSCITPERSAASSVQSLVDRMGSRGCDYHVTGQTSSSLEFEGQCPLPSAQGMTGVMSGHGQIVASATSMNGKFDATTRWQGPGAPSKPEGMHQTMALKWVASDCGDVQPMGDDDGDDGE